VLSIGGNVHIIQDQRERTIFKPEELGAAKFERILRRYLRDIA